MPANSLTRVIVIGGGAAGMIAAIAACHNKAKVTILEKGQRVGRKLLATGNGRCNLTNVHLKTTNYHGQNPAFATIALEKFNVPKTIAFFEHLGIAHKVEEEGKVFPLSGQASSVLDVLRYELEQSGVHVICQAEVTRLKKNSRGFLVQLADKREFRADRVILTVGGKAAPQFGSNGSGYSLAQQLGHTIIEPFPALTQLKLEFPFLKQIKGVKFVGEAAIIAHNQTEACARGEILFAEYGVSGPPILSLSRKAGECMRKNQKTHLKLNMMDFLTTKELTQYLSERFQNRPEKPLSFSLVGFINKRLIPVVLHAAGFKDINKPVGAVGAKGRDEIIKILQDWRFPVSGTTSWPNAQVTAGGVDVRGIEAQTMESKITPGLYLAGEILDIDGDCGGFNLQWAWSSGYVAGENAAADC